MSVQALNHVRKLRAGGFAQGVLLYLAMCHNGETGQCNPTRENIREFFSCDVKRVDRALSALKQAGLIVSIKKPSREGVSNWYVFPNLEGSPQNGIDPKTVGTPQNGNRVAPKMGATGSPQNGEGKSNKKSKEKEVSAPSSEVAPTPASSKPFREDPKENTGAAKTEKTQRNSLIQKENRGAPSMAPNPADSANEIASKSLIQKENEGADTPARTSVKKAAKEEPRGTRFTLEELPDEWREECRRIQPKADPAKVFEEFRDHWISQPGAKGRKSDWTATWRNWCRRINARDLERVGYEPGRAQFMVKPEPVNPFKVTPQNCPPRQKTEEELEAERSFDLFERVLNGEV